MYQVGVWNEWIRKIDNIQECKGETETLERMLAAANSPWIEKKEEKIKRRRKEEE